MAVNNCKKKASTYILDYGICILGKSKEKLTVEYKDLVEIILSKQNLVIHKDEILNKQELTINIKNLEIRGILSF